MQESKDTISDEVSQGFTLISSGHVAEDILLTPEYTLKIPPVMADKIGLKVGDKVVVGLFDEVNCELVVARKFRGDESKQELTKLRTVHTYE